MIKKIIVKTNKGIDFVINGDGIEAKRQFFYLGDISDSDVLESFDGIHEIEEIYLKYMV